METGNWELRKEKDISCSSGRNFSNKFLINIVNSPAFQKSQVLLQTLKCGEPLNDLKHLIFFIFFCCDWQVFDFVSISIQIGVARDGK